MTQEIQTDDVVQYSSISLGRRVSKTESNPLGWQITDKVPADDICVLYLGGDGTQTDRDANGGLKNIQTALQHTDLNLENIKFYGAVYNYGKTQSDKKSHDPKIARNQLFDKFNRKLLSNGSVGDNIADIVAPKYIQQLFDSAILPRITLSNNGKKDVKEVCKNIRRLTIVAFCHGTYVFLKLEEMMQNKLKELGYTTAERNQIQKQLCCVAYAPLAPLGVSKSTLLSFISTRDKMQHDHNNIFERFIHSISIDRYDYDKSGDKIPVESQIPISYFPEKQGNLFISSRILLNSEKDHELIGGYNTPSDNISDSGKIILTLAANAIANSLKSAQNNTPVPDVQSLVTSGNDKLTAIFNDAKKSGAEIYNKMKLLRFNTARLKQLGRETGSPIFDDIWRRFGPFKEQNN